jgi:hypothetical protein
VGGCVTSKALGGGVIASRVIVVGSV